MRLYSIYIVIFLFGFKAYSQSEQLAEDYFKRGEFEKALVSYKKLYNKNTSNNKYFYKLIEIYQELEQFTESEKLIKARQKSSMPQYLVDLGYNYQLQKDEDTANNYYDQAISKISKKPILGYYIAMRFEAYALINRAAIAYETTMALRPQANYNIQLARIYGEQGKVEKMFTNYVNFIERNKSYLNQAKRKFSDYITEHSEDQNNILLRKVLLRKIQSNPDIIWNKLLSWLFIQQKEYHKAFTQEKAIYKRQQMGLQDILDLANLAKEEEQYEITAQILDFVIDYALNVETLMFAHKERLELKIKLATVKDYETIEQEYINLLQEFGQHTHTIDLQLSFAHFIAFYRNDTNRASNFLKETLEINLPGFHEGRVKLKLGDILVFEEKFNEALIYYSQIQRNLKNSTLSQEARFKVAKTSYYKGDFNWAESQLKILKSSTSQLIANDALDLKLLISDNRAEDSLQTALRQYAKADLLAFQNKIDESISLLDNILKAHKTETIIDQTLYKQAELYKNKQNYKKAEANYKKIIANYSEDILADDALFMLAELYRLHLDKPEEAKPLYEQIIFNYQDSIYASLARKYYRTLRGDVIN